MAEVRALDLGSDPRLPRSSKKAARPRLREAPVGSLAVSESLRRHQRGKPTGDLLGGEIVFDSASYPAGARYGRFSQGIDKSLPLVHPCSTHYDKAVRL